MTHRMRLNHVLDRWLFPLWALLCAVRAVAVTIDPDLEAPLEGPSWALVFLPFIASYYSNYHKPALCPSCWARFPDNPGATATGRAWPWLALTHLFVGAAIRLHRRLRINYLVAVTITATPMILGPIFVLAYFLPGPWTPAAAVAYFAFLLHALNRHHQLQPWCPWCGDHGGGGGDGGDADEPPTPDPDPSNSRDLEPTGTIR